MIIAYRAANIADAHLVRQMLEAEGIPAFIQGEYLQGAVGELPANTEILVRVSDDRYDDARAVVAEWESGEPVIFDDDEDGEDATAVATAPTAKRSAIRYFLLFVAIVVGGSIAMMLLRRLAGV